MRWTSKPFFGTPIDRAHPLYDGLTGAWAYNEGQGITIANSVMPGTYDGVLTNTSGGTWGPGPGGWGWTYDGARNHACGVIPALSGAVRATLLIRGASSTSANSGLTGGVRDTGQTYGFGLQATTSTMFAICANGSATYASFPTVAATSQTVVISYDGTQATNAGRLSIYRDGSKLTPTYVGTLPATIGTNGNAFNLGYLYNFRAIMPTFLAMLWVGRSLTADEVAIVTAMPWDLWRPAPGWSPEYVAPAPSATAARRGPDRPRTGSRSAA